MQAEEWPTEVTYKRLPGRRWGALRRASLWDAEDHLLSISGTLFSEQYRRFYYRDIKTIVVQKGPRLGSIAALMALAFLAILTLLPFQTFGPRWIHLLWLFPAGWLAFIAYVSFARSCRVFLYTSVSSEELPALFRQRAAQKALPLLLSKIAAVQGVLPDEARAEIPRGDSVATPPQLQSAPVTQATLFAALVFFAIVIGDAAFAYWYRYSPLTPATFLTAKVIVCILNGFQVAVGVLVLVKLVNVRVLNVVRGFVTAGLLEGAARLYALLIIVRGFRLHDDRLNELIGTVHSRQWVGTIDCGICIVIGITGLIALMMAWQNDQRGQPSSL